MQAVGECEFAHTLLKLFEKVDRACSSRCEKSYLICRATLVSEISNRQDGWSLLGYVCRGGAACLGFRSQQQRSPGLVITVKAEADAKESAARRVQLSGFET